VRQDHPDNAQGWAYQLELEHQQREETMPHIKDMMPSKYLKQGDIGAGLLVTIKAITMVNVASPNKPAEEKYLLHFHELEKPLVMGVVKLNQCAVACGSEISEDWIGKKIVLFRDANVMMGSDTVGGIRIRAPRTAPARPAPVPVATDFDDDIPF
jgi:hypothetical protein